MTQKRTRISDVPKPLNWYEDQLESKKFKHQCIKCGREVKSELTSHPGIDGSRQYWCNNNLCNALYKINYKVNKRNKLTTKEISCNNQRISLSLTFLDN